MRGNGSGHGAPSAPGARGCALVALVGAGPGDPELLTVRGRDLLRRADAVVHDRLVAPDVLGLASPRARLVDVGKRAGAHPVPQGRIDEILVEEARAAGSGGLVVRLKGGDPYVFGRGGEEASYLAAHGVPFEVVPGISSALAAPSRTGIPVTDRRLSSSVHVVTGHRRGDGALDIDFEALARTRGTLVFLMGVATMGELCRGLLDAGMDGACPAAVVERGCTAAQRRIDGSLATIAATAARAGVASPAVLVVGEVCRLAGELDWYGRLPLRGRSVLVTRPRDRAEGLCARLRALGAEVLRAPCIRTVALDRARFEGLLARLPEFSWIALTSTFGVRCLMDAIASSALDLRCLGRLRIAAIGSATAAALAERGLKADFVPEVFDGCHLGRGLAARAQGGRVLLFRAEDALPDVCEELDAAGVAYEDVAAYRTLLAPEEPDPAIARRVADGAVDYVTFTSASTVKGFARAFAGADPARLHAVCLGESTARAAASRGFACSVSAAATIDALVDCLCRVAAG